MIHHSELGLKTTTFSTSNTLKQRAYQLMITGVALLCISCDKNEAPTPVSKANTPKPQNLFSVTPTRSESFWLEGKKQLAAFTHQSQKLHTAVRALLSNPSLSTLQAAQTAWVQTENHLIPLTFYFQLAEASPHHFKTLDNLSKSISGHPIQPGYLDGFGEYSYSGIVHDIGFELSTVSLRQQNRAMDDEEILLGVYAIEYILFGENNRRSDDFIISDALSDEQQKAGLLTPQEIPANRRNLMLDLQTRILLEDIKTLKSLWEEPTNPETISLLQKWDTLSTSNKSTVLTSTIETNIATLVLNIADIMQTLNHSPEDSQAITSKLLALSIHLDASIQALTLLLPKQKQETLDKLRNAKIKLKAINLATNLEEETHTEKKSKQKKIIDINQEKQKALQYIYQEIQSISFPTYISK